MTVIEITTNRRFLIRAVRRLTIYVMVSLFTGAMAMPPNLETLDDHLAGGNSLPYYLENRQDLLDQGIGAPSKTARTEKSSVTGTFRTLAILIEFTDKASSVAAEDFDTLLFENLTNTLRHYYSTVSYGQLDIITLHLPSSIGWITAPQTYAYYCNDSNGTGSYPNNSQKLCEDVVDMIDAAVDFSQYDNDLDGYVDGIILVHSGPGAEYTHSDSDIWSHKWNVWPPRLKDGVYICDYSIQPEYWYSPGDMTCGVFCHEFGHIFGLPDLYDTDYTSRGVGKWSIMGYGSWNGPSGLGGCPAEPDAWARIELEFASAVNVSSNASNVTINNVENGGNIYRLWSSGGIGSEYFLVENRQRTGYDSYLPYDGLLIWHIDETQLALTYPNDNEWYPGHTSSGNYAVALEQADGLYQLEQLASSGDNGDPFPGISSNASFSPLSTPNSNSYDDDNTYVAISNISTSGASMTADFQVSFVSDVNDDESDLLPGRLVLGQNYPNPFNPATRINVNLPVAGHTTITVYDLLGREVTRLLDGVYPAGAVEVIWNALDDDGNVVPSGLYLYEVRTDHERESRKMTLVK
ncbi:MAG: M6 family metalloprotease domain-containing protein [Candidatus Zixiibacteriota bacterium]|nr:MAG: M6 family metalloprotease domain-containing protein [candidate division Zixibacteria bacterium]